MNTEEKTNVFAIVSLVIGVVSIPLAFICCVGLVTSVFGLALGIVGLIKANRGELGGKKLSIAGIFLNILAPVIYAVFFVVIFAMAATNDGQPPSFLETDPLEQLDN